MMTELPRVVFSRSRRGCRLFAGHRCASFAKNWPPRTAAESRRVHAGRHRGECAVVLRVLQHSVELLGSRSRSCRRVQLLLSAFDARRCCARQQLYDRDAANFTEVVLDYVAAAESQCILAFSFFYSWNISCGVLMSKSPCMLEHSNLDFLESKSKLIE